MATACRRSSTRTLMVDRAESDPPVSRIDVWVPRNSPSAGWVGLKDAPKRLAHN